METEENCSLSFLDVDIKRNKSKFSISVYRKSTFSGLVKSYFSFCSYRFKITSIITLFHRAFNICSNYNLLHRISISSYFFVQNVFFFFFLVQSKINFWIVNMREGRQWKNHLKTKFVSLACLILEYNLKNH